MERLKIYMAPLQGLTEAPYRNAFEKHFGGVDVYYTPFIRWEHGGLRRKDVRDLHPDANKVGHLVPQIIAASGSGSSLWISGGGFKHGLRFSHVGEKGKRMRSPA